MDTDYSYGRWCTVNGERYMIIDSTRWTVVVFVGIGESRRYDKSVVSQVSDFLLTDSERQALGYAF